MIREIFTSGYFQFYQNRIKYKVPLKNRSMKGDFLLTATHDVDGRSVPSLKINQYLLYGLLWIKQTP